MGFLTVDYRKGSALTTWTQGDTVDQTSPYRNGQIDLRQEAFTQRLGKGDKDGIAFLPTDSGDHEFRIRVACQHWAPNHSTNDCRFGCAKAEAER